MCYGAIHVLEVRGGRSSVMYYVESDGCSCLVIGYADTQVSIHYSLLHSVLIYNHKFDTLPTP